MTSKADKENNKKVDEREIMDQNKTEPSNSLQERKQTEEPVTLKEARADKSGEDKPVKLSQKETEEVEDSGDKRHGVAPTTGNIVTDEEEAKRAGVTGLEVNNNMNNEEMSEDDQKDLEKELSTDGFVARVITSTGEYLKVKFFKDNKLFTTFKGKRGDGPKAAKEWLKGARERDDSLNS